MMKNIHMVVYKNKISINQSVVSCGGVWGGERNRTIITYTEQKKKVNTYFIQ